METDHTRTSSNNKRIAKNTLLIYFRMLIVLFVGLYTSRVILQVLGVEDFGVYNVVGGIVGMLGFLNATMSGATSRFLTFELGKGNSEKLCVTFNSALVVHFCIALFVFIVAETAGLWFLYHKIVIPEGRMTAAAWIYQFSVFSTMIGITQVPYNASIIAHEKMDVYAYVEIVHTLLKLLIVYLLCVISSDKLIVYGALTFSVSFLIALVYRIYCIRHFQESHFQLRIEKNVVKEMLSFSGYNLFTYLGTYFNQQAIIVIINNLFGVVYNSAAGLASTLANIVVSFANNVVTVFRPPITKSYATGRIEEVMSLTDMAVKLAVYIYFLIAIPVMLEMNYLLHLWLVEVPLGAYVFARLIIIGMLFGIIRYLFNISIHATGNVRIIGIVYGLILFSNPFIAFLLLKYVSNVYLPYICQIIAEAILSLVAISITKKYIPLFSIKTTLYALCKLLCVGLLCSYIVWKLESLLPETVFRIFITCLESTLLLSTLTYSICLNKNQRISVKRYVIRTIKRIKKGDN